MQPEEVNRLKQGRSVVIPFENTGGNFDNKLGEYRRQLEGQEKGLNSMDAKTNKKNRQDYQNRKNTTGNGRDPRSAKEQRAYRRQEINKRKQELMSQGMSKQETAEQAKIDFSNMAALHDPDQVAGGFYDHITGMGDRGVNSSIGSQWGKGNADILEKYVDTLTPEQKLVTLLILR